MMSRLGNAVLAATLALTAWSTAAHADGVTTLGVSAKPAPDPRWSLHLSTALAPITDAASLDDAVPVFMFGAGYRRAVNRHLALSVRLESVFVINGLTIGAELTPLPARRSLYLYARGGGFAGEFVCCGDDDADAIYIAAAEAGLGLRGSGRRPLILELGALAYKVTGAERGSGTGARASIGFAFGAR